MHSNIGSLEHKGTQERVAKIIEDSFDARPMPSGNITKTEVRRRAYIAKEIFDVLYGDLRWSEQRIIDHLLVFLCRALDGVEPIPDWAKTMSDTGSVMWGVEASGRVEKESRLSALSKKENLTATDLPLIIIPGGHNA